ncbi:S-layer homology domain-containing protein [Paenibacillus amylolyticus]|nr:S-layer homology domain-containing protein [Paenibacillus amylolyticus]
MLKYVSGAKNVELSLSRLDTVKLHSDVKSVIASRPVIAFAVQLDGEEMATLNAPVEIRLPYTPDVEELANSKYLTVSYVAANSTFVQLLNGKYDSALQAMVFPAANTGQYAVVYTKKFFNDVIKDSWYAPAIETMASKGIIDGTSATSFSPEQRSQEVSI